jgi:protein arginine kinase activator
MCEECHEKPATIHITKIDNGQKTQQHFCEDCAKNMHALFASGLNPLGLNNEFSIGKLLSSLLQGQEAGVHSFAGDPKCSRCGMTFSGFTKVGRLGCSKCYETFEEQMHPMLRRIHGKTSHVGKVPKRTGGEIRIKNEINRLKRELQEAVNAEEYERAAVLRDKIKAMENHKDF